MATIGSLMIETGLTTVGLKRDLDQAIQMTEVGTRRMKQILDEFGKPVWAEFEKATKEAGVTLRDVEQGVRTTARSVRALAVPVANELAPAFGQTVAQMTQVTTMALSIQRGFGGLALAAVGVAGILAGELISAWRDNVNAKRDFDAALKTGDLGAVEEQARKTTREIRGLIDSLVDLDRQRGGAAAGPNTGGRSLPTLLNPSPGGINEALERDAALKRRREDLKRAEDFAQAEAQGMADAKKYIADQEREAARRAEQEREKAAALAKQLAEQRLREDQALIAEGLRGHAKAIDDEIAEEERLNEKLRELGMQRMRDEQEMNERHSQMMADRARNDVAQLEADARARRQVAEEDQRAQEQLDAGLLAHQEAMIASGTGAARIQAENAERMLALAEEGASVWTRMSFAANTAFIDIARGAEETGDIFVRMVDRMATTLLTDFVDGALQEARVALREFIREAALMGLVRGFAGQIAGGIAGMFGASGGTVVGLQGPSATTSMGVEAGVQATMFAAGGIVTRPTLGIVGESGPEAVVPLDQYRGGGTTVVINDNRGANSPDVEVRESERDGRREVEVFIWETVGRGLGMGAFDRAMGGRYRLNPAGVR